MKVTAYIYKNDKSMYIYCINMARFKRHTKTVVHFSAFVVD